jgi:peptide/nickel transport system permease protein
MPGSFVDYFAQAGATAEQIDAISEKWGLNDPLYIQYFRYLGNLLQGDMGMSFQTRQPVWVYVRQRMFNTLILVAPGIVVAYIIGALYGGLMGLFRGSRFERYGSVAVTVIGMTPEFFTSILLVVIFALGLGWFPATGMKTFGNRATGLSLYLSADFLYHWFLPFMAVVARFVLYPSMIMRTSVVEVRGQDFIKFYKYQGLPKFSRYKHVFKHSSLPVITIFPSSMTRAIGGLVLVETVFAWPGIGALLVDSVLAKDYPVVQFVFFLAAIWVVLGNYAIDIIYSIIDPRIAIESESSS